MFEKEFRIHSNNCGGMLMSKISIKEQILKIITDSNVDIILSLDDFSNFHDTNKELLPERLRDLVKEVLTQVTIERHK